MPLTVPPRTERRAGAATPRAAPYLPCGACWAAGWLSPPFGGGGGAETPRPADRAVARVVVAPHPVSSICTPAPLPPQAARAGRGGLGPQRRPRDRGMSGRARVRAVRNATRGDDRGVGERGHRAERRGETPKAARSSPPQDGGPGAVRPDAGPRGTATPEGCSDKARPYSGPRTCLHGTPPTGLVRRQPSCSAHRRNHAE